MSEPRPIYPKHFLREPVPRANTGFILMPFADEFEPVHEAIRAAIESARLRPLRADDIFSTRSGMEKILRGIAEAEVVVADMTGRNANVFYETGIAHTIKDNVVLLTQNIEDIPFDFRHIDHVEYTSTKGGLEALAEDLSATIASLPPEPPSLASPTAPSSASLSTPADARRELRRLLQQCTREWKDSIVPAQTQVLIERFGKATNLTTTEMEEACELLQPAFLAPWQDLEQLGFEVIVAGEALEAAVPELLEALEQANALCLEQSEPSLTLGHGPLLALRTWTLWGAYALDCESWPAVRTLLHTPINFAGGKRESFSAYKAIHHPKVVHDDARAAARSIYDQSDAFASRRFGSVEVLQGFVGLWLLAAGIAHNRATANKWFPKDMSPTWVLAPRSQFERLATRLATDTTYAAQFSRAVALTDTKELNRTWNDGLRDGLQARGGRTAPRLPDRFAE